MAIKPKTWVNVFLLLNDDETLAIEKTTVGNLSILIRKRIHKYSTISKERIFNTEALKLYNESEIIEQVLEMLEEIRNNGH